MECSDNRDPTNNCLTKASTSLLLNCEVNGCCHISESCIECIYGICLECVKSKNLTFSCRQSLDDTFASNAVCPGNIDLYE